MQDHLHVGSFNGGEIIQKKIGFLEKITIRKR